MFTTLIIQLNYTLFYREMQLYIFVYVTNPSHLLFRYLKSIFL